MNEAISLLVNGRTPHNAYGSRRKNGGRELSPEKFLVSPGQYHAFRFLALFINVVTK